jgi:hypothetical protein
METLQFCVRGEESVAWLSIVVRPLCKTYTMLHLRTYKPWLDKLAGQKYLMVFDRVHIFDMFTHFKFWREMVSTTKYGNENDTILQGESFTFTY